MNLNALRWRRRVLHPQARRPRYVARPEALEDRTLLSVCLVDRLTDLGEGKEFVGDLRYCLTQAQDKDSIQFAVQGTINLTRALPDLTRSISIEGPGANLLTVRRDTGGDYRILTVAGGATVSVAGLTATNGRVSSIGGTISGGGIYNSGTLTINGSIISGNGAFGATGRGGGIVNTGMLVINHSVITGNSAAGVL